MADFTPEASEWDLIGSFSTERTHADDPLYFYISNGSERALISFAVDCGGGRYLCQTQSRQSSFSGIAAAEENPVVKIYEKKRPAYAPIRHIDVLQNVAAIEWGMWKISHALASDISMIVMMKVSLRLHIIAVPSQSLISAR